MRYPTVLIVIAICQLTMFLSVADDPTSAVVRARTDLQDTDFSALDDLIAQLMNQWSIPGVGIAVAKGGQVVHWQGFVFADRDRRLPVESTTLFRIASVSKPITAVAILRLIEAGRLSLETTLAEVMPDLLQDLPDANIPKVTVRQLLQHSAGWDDGDHDEIALRDDVRRLACTVGPQGVVSPTDAVVRRFQRPLDFVPGTDHAYSNFGYLVLGRIAEKISGKPYSGFIQETVFSGIDADCSVRIGSPWLFPSNGAESYCCNDYRGV